MLCLSIIFMPTKTRKSYSLKERPLEALPSSTLCRHWNDMEVILWRVTCHSLLQGRVLASWPYCSRPECPRGDEGIIDVRFLVGVLLQPKVRIQTRPFCMLQHGQCDRVSKINDCFRHHRVWVYSMCAIVTLPLSNSFVLGAFLWVYPSPSSHPTFSRGERGVMLLLYQLTGVLGLLLTC